MIASLFLIILLIFRDCIKKSKNAFENLRQGLNSARSANSLDIKTHISWDFAEQVHIPNSSQPVVCISFFLHIIISMTNK
jgi:hypothetical protein